LEAIKGQQTLAELSKKHDVSPLMISKWKSKILERMAMIFEVASSKEE
jgi:transposase-like protein